MAGTARAAYRDLVHDDPGFAAFFRDITPIAELSDMRLGSRPAARRRAGAEPDEAPPIDALRAIPWTFAWSQSRINLPGWYGLGSGLEAYAAAHGETGVRAISRLYRSWPFLASVIDLRQSPRNAEASRRTPSRSSAGFNDAKPRRTNGCGRRSSVYAPAVTIIAPRRFAARAHASTSTPRLALSHSAMPPAGTVNAT